MNRRTTFMLTGMALLGLAVTALPQVSFGQSNPLIGTWKINFAKSKYSPGPPPRSGATIFEAAGQGLRITAEGIDAQGNPTKVNYGISEFDGKSSPVTGSPDYDAQAATRVDANTIIFSRTKAGKLVQHVIIRVSPGGKTRTVTTTGINAKGQPLDNIAFYDKQ
jgi:hypothetical protein